MIELKELYGILAENAQKKIELEAEDRVINKLIAIEKAKVVEVIEEPCEEVTQEVVEENVEQNSIF